MSTTIEPGASDSGGLVATAAPMQGTIVSIAVDEGDAVRAGAPVLVMESMKMEHVVEAATGGSVRAIPCGHR